MTEELEHLHTRAEVCYRTQQRLGHYTILSENVNTGSELTLEREHVFWENDATFEFVAAAVRWILCGLDDDDFTALIDRNLVLPYSDIVFIKSGSAVFLA